MGNLGVAIWLSAAHARYEAYEGKVSVDTATFIHMSFVLWHIEVSRGSALFPNGWPNLPK